MGEEDIDDSVLPATMTVDWVRVYQTPEDYGEGPESVYLGDAIGGGSRQGVLLWEDDFNGTEVWDRSCTFMRVFLLGVLKLDLIRAVICLCTALAHRLASLGVRQ